MPCGMVWVESFVTGVPSRYEYLCWEGSSGGDSYSPPSGGSSGLDTPPPGVGFNPDPLGSGSIAIADDNDSGAGSPMGLNPGWNSGAHSVETVPADWSGMVTFDVPDVQGARQGGAAVGFSPVANLPTQGRNGYGHLRYGLVFTADTVRVIHAGTVVLELPYADVRAARSGGSTDLVSALLYGAFIKWIVNGVTLFAGTFLMTGECALDATLYLALDAVDNPKFTEGAWGDLEDGSLNGALPGLAMTGDASAETSLLIELPALAAQLSETAICNLFGTMPALRMAGGQGEGITATIGPLQVIAAESSTYGAMVATIGPLTAWIGMGVPDETVKYSVLAPTLPRLAMTASVPATGKLTAALPALGMRASWETTYAEIESSLPGLRMKAYGGEFTPLVQIMETVGYRAPLAPRVYIALAIIERVGADVEAEAFATTWAEALEVVTAEDAATVAATMFTSIMEQLAVGDRLTTVAFDASTGQPVDIGDAWVVNADSKAITRYERYGFNSFAALGGRHFGVRPDGVYLLEGADDAGRAITSGVALGQHDFGTQALKHLDAVYAGVSSTGTLFLRVGVGKSQFTYRARRKDDHMKVQRFDTGRGLRSNYFTFELTSEADAFELDSVTFHVLPSQRRI